jgi:hypothetical protein
VGVWVQTDFAQLKWVASIGVKVRVISSSLMMRRSAEKMLRLMLASREF